MAESTASLLDLSTLVKRSFITIDKKKYDLRNPDELPYLEYRARASQWARLAALIQKPRVSKKEEAEADTILRGLVALIVIAPDKVLAKLQRPQQVQIVTVFSTLLSTARAAGVAQRRGKTSRSTRGVRSRRG